MSESTIFKRGDDLTMGGPWYVNVYRQILLLPRYGVIWEDRNGAIRGAQGWFPPIYRIKVIPKVAK